MKIPPWLRDPYVRRRETYKYGRGKNQEDASICEVSPGQDKQISLTKLQK
jgi:hypothetical protein